MRGAAAPHTRPLGAENQRHRASWVGLGWKALLVAVLLLLMSVDSPLSWALAWAFLNPIQPTFLLWGALLVAVACGNLFEGAPSIRWAWSALTVGAFLALAIPGLFLGAPRLLDALPPVATLTLAAHLGRHDLNRALRDWALVMGLALYAALGVQAMWLLASAFGLGVFVIAALLPPLIYEAISLLLRRVRFSTEGIRDAAALVLATALAVSVISLTQFNRSIPLFWSALFHLIVGLIVGGALLVFALTKPLAEAAFGAYANPGRARSLHLRRALVEFSHAPILISLALYIPLRLFQVAG